MYFRQRSLIEDLIDAQMLIEVAKKKSPNWKEIRTLACDVSGDAVWGASSFSSGLPGATEPRNFMKFLSYFLQACPSVACLHLFACPLSWMFFLFFFFYFFRFPLTMLLSKPAPPGMGEVGCEAGLERRGEETTCGTVSRAGFVTEPSERRRGRKFLCLIHFQPIELVF